MRYGEGGLTPSDVALITDNNRGNNGFGDNSCWWIILFLLFGFGRNGFGGGFGGNGVVDGYVLNNDFSILERRLDNVANGLCDGFYTTAQQIYGIQNSLCQGFNGVNQAINTNGYETRSAINDLGYRLQDCCCQTQRAIDNVNFNNAQNTCAITNAINMSTRDLIENQNANYRAIHEELVANKIEAKNERIAEQQNEINALRLSASQTAQNSYLISELKECPRPAYIVPNPNCCYNYTVNGCGYNTGCNCGSY